MSSCSPVSGSTFVVGTTTVICNAVDTHGNHATQTTFDVVVTDNVAPTMTITLSKTSLKIGDTATITFALSEEPVGFTADDVTIQNGTLTNFAVNGENPKVFTATFTPNANIQSATNVVTV